MSALKRLLIGIIAISLLFSGCNTADTSPAKYRYSTTFIDVFDTVTQILGYDINQDAFDAKINVIHEQLETYHKLYDIYKEYEGINNLRTINENAGIEPVKVDKKIIDLLKFSIDLYDKTNRQVNIAMGSVLKIWHNYRTFGSENPSEAALPTTEELEKAAEHININDIIIDEEASTVYLADPNMSLDVGSIGKGYAVQRVAEYVKELGYDNYVLSVGGNVISIGSKFDGSAWRLGIQNPDLSSDQVSIALVDIVNLCLVTSGDYQRYYIVDNKEYCHIIDPDTLMPANYYKSVSIISDNSGLADALSTSLFNMEYEEGLALINTLDNTEAMWIFEDGTIKYSEKFEEYIVK